MLFYKCYETFKLTQVVTDAFILLLKMIECTIHTVLKTSQQDLKRAKGCLRKNTSNLRWLLYFAPEYMRL